MSTISAFAEEKCELLIGPLTDHTKTGIYVLESLVPGLTIHASKVEGHRDAMLLTFDRKR